MLPVGTRKKTSEHMASYGTMLSESEFRKGVCPKVSLLPNKAKQEQKRAEIKKSSMRSILS